MKQASADFIRIAFSALFFGALFPLVANADVPEYLFLKCEAQQEVTSQPCGGFNTRVLKIYLATANAEYSGFREARTYGGCYPISDDLFGKATDVQVQGHVVTFKLEKAGYFAIGDIPHPVLPGQTPEVTPARYDLATQKLTLDTSATWWPYQKPAELTCGPLVD